MLEQVHADHIGAGLCPLPGIGTATERCEYALQRTSGVGPVPPRQPAQEIAI